MLYTEQNWHGWNWDNWSTTDTPTGTPLQVTAGGSADTFGTTLNISTSARYGAASSARLPLDKGDCYLMELCIGGMYTNGAARGAVANIYIDPAGGTSWSLFAENILHGQQPMLGDGTARWIMIPCRIPAGASVGCAIASSQASATARVVARYFGGPSRPELAWAGQGCESIGITTGAAPTNCDGTGFTPGNSGTWGSWQSLGTCANRLRYINLVPQIRNATAAARSYFFELGYGDATNPVIVVPRVYTLTTANEMSFGIGNGYAPCDIPAGSTLYVRGVSSGTTDTGWTAMALGVY